MTIRLAEAEALALEAFCRRQLRWDESLPARIVTSANALGVFTTPPLGVLVFVAVPTVGPVTPAEAADVIVPLDALAKALQGAATSGIDVNGLPRAVVPVSAALSLQHLPPGQGWQLPIFAVAGDLVPRVEEATAEFDTRAVGLPPKGQESLAEEIWDRPGFGGLPMRALHAARQLGMIADDSSRVAAATSGPWKRLSTQRGQVFVHATGSAARLALHIVR